MKRKGFTLVELLAVIAILAILVIIALPNVLKMYNNAKKNSFLTEAKTLAQDVSSKYITESMKGNKLTTISNKQNSLDLSGRNIEYSFDLDEKGKIKRMMVYDGTYCVVTTKDYTNLKTSDVSESCSYDEIHNIAGTLSKNFYEKSGKTDRLSVNSIIFSNKNITVDGVSPIDVSVEQNGSIKMYIKPISDSSSYYDITISADGNIAFPEDSTSLLSFGRPHSSNGYFGALKKIEFNNSIDTSKVKNMSKMFWSNNELKTLDLSSFDTSKVTNMSEMFVSVGIDTLDLSNFDTSNVINMSGMFGSFPGFSGKRLREIKGLNKFDTSKVTDMSGMFYVSAVTSLDLSSFDTSNVTDMGSMFSGIAIDTLDLSNFDTSNVTDMSGMFGNFPGFSRLKEIKGLNKFNTSNVTNMVAMFCYSEVPILDLSNFDASKVTDMSGMFSGAKTTTGYARTQADADKFNNSSDKPSTLTFTVK